MNKLKKILYPSIIIGLLSAFIFIWLSGTIFYKVLELKTIDIRYNFANIFHKFKPSEDIVIIAIDDETERKMIARNIPRIFWVPYICLFEIKNFDFEYIILCKTNLKNNIFFILFYIWL